ncbi:coproporphyrinogen III oxidase, anaerobic [Cohaesibacter sp. ES.047]|uniref:radical SAM family heme chaperone HemW n=1 Tax=Cohaesibacter sp. ES.047 TaxID=1798205 RepID=UPI000BBFA2EB|nr:radical SAM family heme chaperone HemW [Cohaesibacter sp. ES.047]SNY90468.1 coproporphyrinogen III oxidase, anaerobic [Cohaesibacter sp. ES.047]
MAQGQSNMPGPDNPGFGIYLHWPFCLAKCPYCDFNSHVRHKPVDQDQFGRAMISELRHYAARIKGAGVAQPVTSVFFGGGTPSLMQPSVVASLLDEIADLWDVAPDAEITLEANPTSVEADHFKGYALAGVNRVSLGVQSLYDDQLKFLGRLHSAEEAKAAILLAQKHFPRMSFDLIYARPHQTPELWAKELNEAVALAADHLSLYQLTIEQDTPFFALYRNGKFELPDEDTSVALYEMTHEALERHGMPAYEISNHARPGFESRHNLTYWRYGDYVGAGAGAHGRLTLPNGRIATANERHPESWLKRVEERGTGALDEDILTLEQQGDECLIMGLRVKEGINLDRYAAMAGRSISDRRIDDLVSEGLLDRIEPRRIRATRKGFLLLNALVAELAG